MTIFVGILNLLGLLAWTGLMLFLYAVSGGRSWDSTTLFLYCGPLAYFVLCFISTLPFVRGPAMATLGILANLALIPFVGAGLSQGGVGLLVALPFLGLTALWYLAYKNQEPP